LAQWIEKHKINVYKGEKAKAIQEIFNRTLTPTKTRESIANRSDIEKYRLGILISETKSVFEQISRLEGFDKILLAKIITDSKTRNAKLPIGELHQEAQAILNFLIRLNKNRPTPTALTKDSYEKTMKSVMVQIRKDFRRGYKYILDKKEYQEAPKQDLEKSTKEIEKLRSAFEQSPEMQDLLKQKWAAKTDTEEEALHKKINKLKEDGFEERADIKELKKKNERIAKIHEKATEKEITAFLNHVDSYGFDEAQKIKILSELHQGNFAHPLIWAKSTLPFLHYEDNTPLFKWKTSRENIEGIDVSVDAEFVFTITLENEENHPPKAEIKTHLKVMSTARNPLDSSERVRGISKFGMDMIVDPFAPFEGKPTGTVNFNCNLIDFCLDDLQTKESYDI
jgi:hypothetical protein